jgi:hypothetical protein
MSVAGIMVASKIFIFPHLEVINSTQLISFAWLNVQTQKITTDSPEIPARGPFVLK